MKNAAHGDGEERRSLMYQRQRSNQVMILLLAVIMVVAMMPSMVFATDFSNDHDRISIATGEPLYVEWNS